METTTLGYNEKRLLELLKEKPLKATEIRNKLAIDQSTLYKMIRHLETQQLIKVGYIRLGRVKAEALCYLPDQEGDLKAGKYGMVYLPIEKVPEGKPLADKEAILDMIGKINDAISSEKWNICHSLIIELKQLCIFNRTGRITELLDTIKSYINTRRLFENEQSQENMAIAMSHILRNEKDSGEVKTVNEVIEKFSEPARKIALSDRKNGLIYALDILGETEDKKSVDVIMTIISQVTDEAKRQEIEGRTDSLHRTLYGSRLGKKQGAYIQEKLVELSNSENEYVKTFVRRIQEKSRFYN